MSTLLHEVLGAPTTPAVSRPTTLEGVDTLREVPETPHDVKRLRIGEYGGRLLLGLNKSAARDLMSTQAFWDHMDKAGQIPIFLRQDLNELIPGYFSDAQAVLIPKQIDLRSHERGPDLTEQQIMNFARMCVEGQIVRRWAVPEADAAQRGVIVCDNRQVLPENAFDTGPGNSDVIAASLGHYEPRQVTEVA